MHQKVSLRPLVINYGKRKELAENKKEEYNRGQKKWMIRPEKEKIQ